MNAKQSTNITGSSRTRYQRVVADVGELALSTTDVDRIFSEIVTSVVSIMRVDFCDVLELLPDGSFFVRAGSGWPQDLIGTSIEAGPHTLAGATILNRRTSITEDFSTDIQFRPTQSQRIQRIVSGMTILVHNSIPFGVLGVYTTARRKFDSEEIDFLQSIANIVSDVIERRELEAALRMAEDKYRTLFEESMDVVFFSTATGELIDINPAGVRLFEFASREEMIGINIEQDLYVDPSARKQYYSVLHEQGAVKDFEFRLKTRSGRTVIVLESSTAIRDSKGNLIAYRGIIRDITLLRETQQSLKNIFQILCAFVSQREPCPEGAKAQ